MTNQFLKHIIELGNNGGGSAIRGITQRVFHKHSVLDNFAKIGPQRASGVRIVALRPCCCFEPRRASVELL